MLTSPKTLLAAAVALLVAAVLLQARWRRGRIVRRFREGWGRVPPVRRALDHRAAEAWDAGALPFDRAAAIDERTWDDLDLDAVLGTLDRTCSGLGSQMLYWRMRSGARWRDAPGLSALADAFGRDPALRDRAALELSGGGRSLGHWFWTITVPGLISRRWWYWVFPVLALLMAASIVTTPFHPRALIVVFALLALNLVVRMVTAWQVPGLLPPMRQLGPVIRTATRLARVLGNDGTVANAPVAEIHALRRLRWAARWVTRDPLASGELVAAAWEYFNLLFVLDANALLFTSRLLQTLGPTLARVAGWVGDVDLSLAVAAIRAEPRSWAIPRWSGEPATEGIGIWHPLLDAPVANDIALIAGHGIIITGANMSGKSTYLRSVGLAAELARAFDTCPAASWAGRELQVRTLIGRNDDLLGGRSYYQVEVDGVVEMMRAARRAAPTLFILDELLRGTNTVERLAAGEAVLRALLAPGAAPSPHSVLVATHDGELVAMLADCYTPYHFREEMSAAGGLHFAYRRLPGPATTRTAIALLEASGAPPEVIAAARARADRLDPRD